MVDEDGFVDSGRTVGKFTGRVSPKMSVEAGRKNFLSLCFRRVLRRNANLFLWKLVKISETVL